MYLTGHSIDFTFHVLNVFPIYFKISHFKIHLIAHTEDKYFLLNIYIFHILSLCSKIVNHRYKCNMPNMFHVQNVNIFSSGITFAVLEINQSRVYADILIRENYSNMVIYKPIMERLSYSVVNSIVINKAYTLTPTSLTYRSLVLIVTIYFICLLKIYNSTHALL